jgi:hypothetical protein
MPEGLNENIRVLVDFTSAAGKRDILVPETREVYKGRYLDARILIMGNTHGICTFLEFIYFLSDLEQVP